MKQEIQNAQNLQVGLHILKTLPGCGVGCVVQVCGNSSRPVVLQSKTPSQICVRLRHRYVSVLHSNGICLGSGQPGNT